MTLSLWISYFRRLVVAIQRRLLGDDFCRRPLGSGTTLQTVQVCINHVSPSDGAPDTWPLKGGGGGGLVTLAAVQPLRIVSSELTTPAVGVSTPVRRQVSAVRCFLLEGMVRSTARSTF